MPPRTIQESHRPRVSNRTMRCHSSSGQLSGLFVSENGWRCHNREMEPQRERSVSPLPATKRIGRLRKTTRRSWVHAQSVGLNAERKVSQHRAEGKVFLLTFPYIGRLRANSCARQLRGFCFPGSSPPRLNNIPQRFTTICLIGRVSSHPRRRSSGEELSSFGYPIQRYAINFQSEGTFSP